MTHKVGSHRTGLRYLACLALALPAPTPTLPVVPLLPTSGVPMWAFVFAAVVILVALVAQGLVMSQSHRH
jgi:hypothetical protein